MTIREAQERIDAWIKEYGVRYFNELTNMAILTEEIRRTVFQRRRKRRPNRGNGRRPLGADVPCKPNRSGSHKGIGKEF